MSAIMRILSSITTAIAGLAGGGMFGQILAVVASAALVFVAFRALTALIGLVGKIIPGVKLQINWSRWGNIALIAFCVIIALVAMGWTGPLPFGLGQVQGGQVQVDTAPVAKALDVVLSKFDFSRSGVPPWKKWIDQNLVQNPATSLPAVPLRFETREETVVEGREIVSMTVQSVGSWSGINGSRTITGTLPDGQVVTQTVSFSGGGHTVTETETIPVVINPGITRTVQITVAVFIENPLLQEDFLREEVLEEPIGDYLQVLAEQHVDVGSRYCVLDIGEGHPVSWDGRKDFVYSAYALDRALRRAEEQLGVVITPTRDITETMALAFYNAMVLALDRGDIPSALPPANQLMYDIQLDNYWVVLRSLEGRKAAIVNGVVTDPAEIRSLIDVRGDLLAEVETLMDLGTNYVAGSDIVALHKRVDDLNKLNP